VSGANFLARADDRAVSAITDLVDDPDELARERAYDRVDRVESAAGPVRVRNDRGNDPAGRGDGAPRAPNA